MEPNHSLLLAPWRGADVAKVKARRASLSLRLGAVFLAAGLVTIGSSGMSSASTSHSAKNSRTARICNDANACPEIVATAKSSTTDHELTRFLLKLWMTNFRGGPSGTYQLQRCGSPGAPPYHVQCVLFTSGTSKDLAALRSAFESSQLFSEVASSP
jgi:hypothetical protein